MDQRLAKVLLETMLVTELHRSCMPSLPLVKGPELCCRKCRKKVMHSASTRSAADPESSASILWQAAILVSRSRALHDPSPSLLPTPSLSLGQSKIEKLGIDWEGQGAVGQEDSELDQGGLGSELGFKLADRGHALGDANGRHAAGSKRLAHSSAVVGEKLGQVAAHGAALRQRREEQRPRCSQALFALQRKVKMVCESRWGEGRGGEGDVCVCGEVERWKETHLRLWPIMPKRAERACSSRAITMVMRRVARRSAESEAGSMYFINTLSTHALGEGEKARGG